MNHPESATGTLIRAATAADAATIAEIDRAARAAALPTVRWAHSPAEIRRWIAETLVPRGGVWLAERGGASLGYMALHQGWVDQLYIHPDHWRRGLGAALLDHAKRRHQQGLRLWCFQVNTRAGAFYQAHGFVALEHTDGAANEEHEPDTLYAWPKPPWHRPPAGPRPLA